MTILQRTGEVLIHGLKIIVMKLEVIDVLKGQEENTNYPPFRVMKSIVVGGYRLSVQGSEGHYCSPRQTLPIDDYWEMEVAIINGKNAMVNARKSSFLRKFARYLELVDRMDGCRYGYVPVDLINDLYLYLKTRDEKV